MRWIMTVGPKDRQQKASLPWLERNVTRPGTASVGMVSCLGLFSSQSGKCLQIKTKVVIKGKTDISVSRAANRSAVVCRQSLFICVRLAVALIYSRLQFRRKVIKAGARSLMKRVASTPGCSAGLWPRRPSQQADFAGWLSQRTSLWIQPALPLSRLQDSFIGLRYPTTLQISNGESSGHAQTAGFGETTGLRQGCCGAAPPSQVPQCVLHFSTNIATADYVLTRPTPQLWNMYVYCPEDDCNAGSSQRLLPLKTKGKTFYFEIILGSQEVQK